MHRQSPRPRKVAAAGGSQYWPPGVNGREPGRPAAARGHATGCCGNAESGISAEGGHGRGGWSGRQAGPAIMLRSVRLRTGTRCEPRADLKDLIDSSPVGVAVDAAASCHLLGEDPEIPSDGRTDLGEAAVRSRADRTWCVSRGSRIPGVACSPPSATAKSAFDAIERSRASHGPVAVVRDGYQVAGQHVANDIARLCPYKVVASGRNPLLRSR